jgi:DNA-directed RNA polymerase subunit K/omega
MDPLAVFDCKKFLPNSFPLALAAAAGAERFTEERNHVHAGRPASASDLALREIADGAFRPADLALLLGEPNATRLYSPSVPRELCGGASAGPPPACPFGQNDR